jgi:hypothetical protein
MPIIGRTSRWVWAVILVLGLAAVAALSGPLFPFMPLPSDVADVVGKAPDLDGYLRQREARHSDIKPGLAKTILWNDPVHATRRRSRWSICTDSPPAEKTSRPWSRPWRARSAPTLF